MTFFLIFSNGNVRELEALQMPCLLYFLYKLRIVKTDEKNCHRTEEEMC
jgi:hypothetical protein